MEWGYRIGKMTRQSSYKGYIARVSETEGGVYAEIFFERSIDMPADHFKGDFRDERSAMGWCERVIDQLTKPPRTDTERLDWVEKNQARVYCARIHPNIWEIEFFHDSAAGRKNDLRSAIDKAIDQAMDKEKAPKKGD